MRGERVGSDIDTTHPEDEARPRPADILAHIEAYKRREIAAGSGRGTATPS
jgi:indole-3-glycerol phosphate synthase